MAGPIGHIVLTAKIFDTFFGHLSKKDFFIGTCFPDIRYLRVIEREKTHFNRVSLHKIQNKSSFMAGVQFHSLVDDVREKYMDIHSIYSLLPKSNYITQAVKIYEDELYSSSINDWNEYRDYLNEILPEQLNFGIQREAIHRWHSLLQQYFAHGSNRSSVQLLCAEFGFPDEVVTEIFNSIAVIKSNEDVQHIIHSFYENFHSLLMKSQSQII